MTDRSTFRIASIVLDEKSVVKRTREIEQEREIAIYDLMESNYFRPDGSKGGPYHLVLGVKESRLIFDVKLEGGSHHARVMLSLTPFHRVVKDYFMVCENYFKAIRTAPPSQIEALDMGRRGLHNEGSELLKARLRGKIEVDLETARRLFTLICVLHLKG